MLLFGCFPTLCKILGLLKTNDSGNLSNHIHLNRSAIVLFGMFTITFDCHYRKFVLAKFFVGALFMAFLDVAFLPSRINFPPLFLKIVVEVKSLGPPHALKLWLGVSNVKYICFNKASFCFSKISWRS